MSTYMSLINDRFHILGQGLSKFYVTLSDFQIEDLTLATANYLNDLLQFLP